MERLNLHLLTELAQSFDVRLIGPTGAAVHAPGCVPVAEAPLRPLSRFLLTAGRLAIQQARNWKPHVVVAGSGLTAPFALLAARACGARSVAYLHGLDLTVPHPVYRALWLPAIRRLDRVVVNSAATAEIARGIGVPPEHLTIVPPGVALPAQDTSARTRFRAAHGLEGCTVLLSVGRLTARKGLREFVTEVLPTVVTNRPDSVLVVIGDVPENALYAQAQTPSSIQEAARRGGVEGNIRFLGTCSDLELNDAYAGADLHVFPVRYIPNDPEGFGMVAIEAASHGLATVAYATGGVTDAVKDGLSGRLLAPGDTAGFGRAVLSLLENPPARGGVVAFAQQFSWDNFGERMRTAIDQEVANGPGRGSSF